MKTLFPLMLVLLGSALCTHLPAQNLTYAEKIVAIAPLSFDRTTASQESAEKLYHYLFNALFNTKRFTVVDRLNGFERVVFERKTQESIDFIDGKVVAQGKLKGASLMIFAHLNSAQASENKDQNGKTTSYSGDLSIFVRIVDVETGQVTASQIITPTGISTIGKEVEKQNPKGLGGALKGIFSGGCGGNTPQAAIESCMAKIETHIQQFVSDNFPLELHVVKVMDTEKGKEYWLLGAGTNSNLKVGGKLSVIRTQKENIGGKMFNYEQEVLRFKIIRDAGDFIICLPVDKKEQAKEVNLQAPLKMDPNSIKVVEIK